MRYADITFRPIDEWPGDLTRGRRRAQFSARWGQTIELLERELTNLQARQVVFQIAVDERDLRIDGGPRAHARAEHPGVILAFESKFGPLKYVVDTFDRWEDNVRAIALAMEALRKVDRYGVTKRGEQYTGWRQLTSGTHDNAEDLAHASDAVRLVASLVEDLFSLDDVAGAFQDVAVREAIRRTHPDRGGDPETFRKVIRAKELLA